ncbi:thioredoxin family protein [bacterium]|nr:thioredoxin family protein [bacterium]MBU1991008.1 thioredoxin family protein [bacterium]
MEEFVKFFIIFFTMAMTLFGANIDTFAANMGYYRDYDTALVQAKKENKPLMLVLVGDYCPWCRKFERKTLQRESVALSVNKNFIPLIVDRNLDKKSYPEAYSSPRIPTTYFIDPKKGAKLFESLGYVKKDEFLATIDEVLQKYKK